MRGLPGGTSAARVVQLLLQLAAGLGVDALAEGIETPEQLEFLIAHGCGIGQGFHFSRPVPADDLVRLLGDWPLAA
jgi:EAL domain-containing protein (putative c-di-GMP-specific phosphodiesterase class I)